MSDRFDQYFVRDTINKISQESLRIAEKRGKVSTEKQGHDFYDDIKEEIDELENSAPVFVEGRYFDFCRDALERGDLAQFKILFERGIKDTTGDELADVVLSCLTMARAFNFDIGSHIMLKQQYNSIRDE